MRLAITGGTGFVGSHLIEAALGQGHVINALTRQAQPPTPGLTWIEGALDRSDSLDLLCRGCDAVVHVAGVVNGTPEAFHQGNVMGTESVVAAAARAGIRRFIHISSLSAREPQLSAYGRSKLESEEPVMAAGGNWTIIRPPAIYGPRDREMLDLFRFARFGLLPLPPNKRLSIIHAGDLCGLILACLGDTISHARVYEPDDGRIDGWAPPDLARAIGRAVGRQVLPVTIPKGVLLLGVPLDRMLRGAGAKLTRDRVNYFSHPDWTAEASARPPENLWQPRIPTELGLAETARWYKASGWL